MRIETERLVLRRWTTSDIDALTAIQTDPRVAPWLGHPTRDDVERSIERYERSWDSLGVGRFAMEERATGALVGKAGIMHDPAWTAGPTRDEIGWTVAADRWARGYATEGARATMRDGLERVGLTAVVSFTQPHNHASRRVMEKLELAYQGTTDWLGQTWVWYVAAL